MVNLLARRGKKTESNERLLGGGTKQKKGGLFGKKQKQQKSSSRRSDDHSKGELDAASDYVVPTPPVTPDNTSSHNDDNPNVNVVTVQPAPPDAEEYSLYSDLTENCTYGTGLPAASSHHAQARPQPRRQNDPPGDMTRSSSNTDPVTAMKEHIHQARAQKEQQQQQTESSGIQAGCFHAPSNESASNTMLSRLLGVVDVACAPVSGRDPLPSEQEDSIRKVLSFSPEWGMAPTRDEDDTMYATQSVPQPTTSFLSSASKSFGMAAAPSSPNQKQSQQQRRPLSNAATVTGAPTTTRTSANNNNNKPTTAAHDSFELVLEDIALEAKYGGDSKYAYKYPHQRAARAWMFSRNTKTTKESSSVGPTQSSVLRNVLKSHRYRADHAVEEEKKEDGGYVDLDESNRQKAITEVNVPGARKINMEHRYKQILESFKNSSKKKLATVKEGQSSEYTEMKVRVPGIEKPDAYLTESNLIGDQYIEETILEDFKKKRQQSLTKQELWTKEVRRMKLKDDVKKIPEEPVPLNKSRSLKERLGLKRTGSTSNDDSSQGGSGKRSLSSSESLTRQRSAPADSMSKSFRMLQKKEKPTWKSAVDKKTGRTYYYHRVTRQTTWSKPKDFDAKSIVPYEDDIKVSMVPAVKMDGATIELRKQTPRDFDPIVWDKKQEIARLLTSMAPPDVTSVERLMSQYEGNEDELLKQLREMVQSQPFDEPVAKSSDRSQSNEERNMDSPGRSSVSSGLKGRTRTVTSFMSGYSGFSGNTGTTKVSEQTEPIRNTGKSSIGVIPEHGLPQSSDAHRMAPGTAKYIRPPSTIPVPRSRELHVEEFANDRVKLETYDVKETVRDARRARLSQNQPQRPLTSRPDAAVNGYDSASPYHGDNDDTDQETKDESLPTDSISALSETDVEYDGKDDFEMARRKALDEAIAREDWELAQALSERMRMGNNTKSRQTKPSKEWKQSELDKFISDNDWDAVANYIARVRNNAKNDKATSPGKSEPARQQVQSKSPNDSKGAPSLGSHLYTSGSVSSASNPQKRFGARSQLQHSDLHSVSSWDSEGDSRSDSYYSEDGSESSFYSDEDPLYVAANKRRTAKEFAC